MIVIEFVCVLLQYEANTITSSQYLSKRLVCSDRCLSCLLLFLLIKKENKQKICIALMSGENQSCVCVAKEKHEKSQKVRPTGRIMSWFVFCIFCANKLYFQRKSTCERKSPGNWIVSDLLHDRNKRFRIYECLFSALRCRTVSKRITNCHSCTRGRTAVMADNPISKFSSRSQYNLFDSRFYALRQQRGTKLTKLAAGGSVRCPAKPGAPLTKFVDLESASWGQYKRAWSTNSWPRLRTVTTATGGVASGADGQFQPLPGWFRRLLLRVSIRQWRLRVGTTRFRVSKSLFGTFGYHTRGSARRQSPQNKSPPISIFIAKWWLQRLTFTRGSWCYIFTY